MNLNTPAAVGVPLINPELLRLRPEGRSPVKITHVNDEAPDAVSWYEYGVPVVPSGSGDEAVINGALDAEPEPIIMVNARVIEPVESVALTMNVNVPLTVGIPVIVPLEFSVRPEGSEPLTRVHVIVPVPVAMNLNQ